METIETEDVKFWFEDGILYSKYLKPTDSNLEFAKMMIEVRHNISNNKKQYWCFDLYNVKTFSKESRDYADIHGQDFLHATAGVVHSHTTKFFVNVFLKIKKPRIPFMAFNDVESAVIWLKEQKKMNEVKGIF